MAKNLALYLLSSFIIIFSCKGKNGNLYQHNANDSMVYVTVKAFPVYNGWGYDICADSKIFIHQDRVPAIGANRIFTTKDDALKAGNLVVNKMKRNESFSIDSTDMANAGINYTNIIKD